MRRKTKFKRYRPRRGIYVLPNIFTSLNLFCGFYALIASIDGKFIAAAVAIIIGVVFDTLDGKIARATKTSSRFGVEYDSLADLITFGLSPGVMMYLWALKPLGRIGWLAAFLFMACGALRLARFNTQSGSIRSDYFFGLPIPAAAGMNATTVLLFQKLGMGGNEHPVIILVMIYLLSFLMVSTIKYYSFKELELFRKMKFNVLVTAILILIFIASQPSIALFLFGVVYILSGPFVYIRHYRKLKQTKPETHKINNHESTSI